MRPTDVLTVYTEVPHVKALHSDCHHSNKKEDIKHFSKDPSQEGSMEYLIAWEEEEGRGRDRGEEMMGGERKREERRYE